MVCCPGSFGVKNYWFAGAHGLSFNHCVKKKKKLGQFDPGTVKIRQVDVVGSSFKVSLCWLRVGVRVILGWGFGVGVRVTSSEPEKIIFLILPGSVYIRVPQKKFFAKTLGDNPTRLWVRVTSGFVG